MLWTSASRYTTSILMLFNHWHLLKVFTTKYISISFQPIKRTWLSICYLIEYSLTCKDLSYINQIKFLLDSKYPVYWLKVMSDGIFFDEIEVISKWVRPTSKTSICSPWLVDMYTVERHSTDRKLYSGISTM